VGVGAADPSPVFDDPVFDDPGRFEPGRFNVGRSAGVGVEEGGGVGEGDCAVAVAIRNSNKMNDDKVRMNSIRLLKDALTTVSRSPHLCRRKVVAPAVAQC
jgi:hypothetical protein